MQAAIEAVMPLPCTTHDKARVCLWLAALGCGPLREARSPALFESVARAVLAAFKQALVRRRLDSRAHDGAQGDPYGLLSRGRS